MATIFLSTSTTYAAQTALTSICATVDAAARATGERSKKAPARRLTRGR
jgi:hypothetical protein